MITSYMGTMQSALLLVQVSGSKALLSLKWHPGPKDQVHLCGGHLIHLILKLYWAPCPLANQPSDCCQPSSQRRNWLLGNTDLAVFRKSR